MRSYCVSLRTPVRSGRGATSTVYVVDGFLIDWLCCRAASASQQLQLQRQQSYWCYWAAVGYNPIYTWHEARLEQITPNPIRWKGAQLTEPLTFTWLQFFFAGLLPGGGWGNNVKITINDLDFSRHWTVSWVQSCESYLLLFMRSSLSPPLPDSLTHPLCLFILLPFSFFFLPTISSSFPSLFLLCYTVEQLKSFLYPTYHSLVPINSIYVCLNHKVREVHAWATVPERAPTSTCETCTRLSPTHKHAFDLIHLLRNIIRISSSQMTQAARDGDYTWLWSVGGGLHSTKKLAGSPPKQNRFKVSEKISSQ